jgi:hypothetical protein
MWLAFRELPLLTHNAVTALRRSPTECLRGDRAGYPHQLERAAARDGSDYFPRRFRGGFAT